MALLLSHLSFLPSSSLSPHPHSPSITISSAATLSQRLLQKNITLKYGFSPRIRVSSPTAISGRRSLVVRATSEIDGKGEGQPDPLPPSQRPEEDAVPVENLPLESKMKERAEQKLRMKLAKKIRLRRKRLVHKRHLRKKGRWPPSKMKKLKNV